MAEKSNTEGMLSPYRVLDLTDEKGLLCGKLLGDLGADVIKVEKPGGDPARNHGPFFHDKADRENSLFWFAFNTSKRGITLDIETADGQGILEKLVKGADFVIESFPPGYMDSLGLGYSALEKINPQLIMISITPFGQSGPYKGYKGPDIVAWAMGGEMYVSGDTDRPPVRISHHSQAYLHAAAEGAVGAMIALSFREMTGEGQQVDVSIQESVVRVSHQIATIPWDTNMNRFPVNAVRGTATTSGPRMTHLWNCRDGYIIFQLATGQHAKRWNLPLVQLMKSEGMADDFLQAFDWDTFNLNTITQETVDVLEERIRGFFMAHTKATLLEGAARYRLMLFPVASTADIQDNIQLDARRFWVELEHAELGTTIIYPGGFAKTNERPPRISCRAPLVGEHNEEVYQKELGLSREKLQVLKEANVI